MARIEKQGNKVTLSMTVDEAVMLQSVIEKAGNVAARTFARETTNGHFAQEAGIAMKALWSFSDHLDVPHDEKHSYSMEFRLP